ncbi:hypothetical protein [Nocardioides speluncae]|uniref:hypothetical protein n=1 Tax=Nocardioides speluncae TaxID=2670337 RepID=UPI001F0BE28A|nr:hypothetical protein [Nocardioides speluncae]
MVGPPQAVTAFEQGTAQLGENALDLTTLDSREEAVEAIQDREVYAAFVLDPAGTETLTASAASPTVAQLARDIGSHAAGPDAPPGTVTDVVPLPEDDPRGAVFSSGALPLAIGGIITGVVFGLVFRGREERVIGVLGVSAAAGLALAGVMQGWLDVLGGSYWANAGVMALGIAAIAAVIVGLVNQIGPPGIALGAIVVMLLGNPLSGLTSAPELLPTGWGAFGQVLPPGATGTGLRSTAFFDGAAVGTPLIVLGCWVLAGVVLIMLPSRRTTEEVQAVAVSQGTL